MPEFYAKIKADVHWQYKIGLKAMIDSYTVGA